MKDSFGQVSLTYKYLRGIYFVYIFDILWKQLNSWIHMFVQKQDVSYSVEGVAVSTQYASCFQMKVCYFFTSQEQENLANGIIHRTATFPPCMNFWNKFTAKKVLPFICPSQVPPFLLAYQVDVRMHYEAFWWLGFEKLFKNIKAVVWLRKRMLIKHEEIHQDQLLWLLLS